MWLSIGPRGRPRNAAVFQVTATSITLVWEQVDCLKRNGPIIGYQINLYYEHQMLRRVYLEGANTSRHTLDDLTHSKHVYSIGVAAVNEAGVGPFRLLQQIESTQGMCVNENDEEHIGINS